MTPNPKLRIRIAAWLSVGAALSVAVACGGKSTSTSGEGAVKSIRLVDLFQPNLIKGSAQPAAEATKPVEWRFDQPLPADAKNAATGGWDALDQVADLRIENNNLAGTSTGDYPMIHVERVSGLEDLDSVAEFVVRLKVSDGANLSIGTSPAPQVTAEQIKALPWFISTPLIPGDELQTYTLDAGTIRSMSQIRHIAIRPTDATGAKFEIESVRLVSRREKLAEVPSGVGWQGLSEIYRETLVSRSPETIRIPAKLGQRPWLDLAVGTIGDDPVTFKVTAAHMSSGGPTPNETVLLERTVTRPHEWELAPVDLSTFAGNEVSLTLALSSAENGAVGFWGNPVIREHAPASKSVAGQTASAERPQGVILIMADTLRRDHLNGYGYSRETAPTLAKMAAEGALFKDCIAQATWTKVSTPSIMTGLYPRSHTVHDFTDRLPSSATTLAEVYRDAGYATLSLSSVLFTGKFTNLHQGFEELHESGAIKPEKPSKTAHAHLDNLLPWIERHRDVPFFVFYHLFDPHDPFEPYRPYDSIWADPAKRAEHEEREKKVREKIKDPLMKNFGMPSKEELAEAGVEAEDFIQYNKDWYDGSIRQMDVEIARLLERLRELGLADKTLVVFTSDHGEEFLEHGRTFHGHAVYGELTNVPLIMWKPGVIAAGTAVDHTVRSVDIMPTLLDLSGLTAPAGIHGQSLAPLVVAQPPSAVGPSGATNWSPQPAVSEKAITTSAVGPPDRERESYSVISDGWRLIRHVTRPEGVPEFELYNHKEDPFTLKDVAAEHPDIVQRLTADYDVRRHRVDSDKLKSDTDTVKEASSDELKRLRGLGYLK